MACFFAVTSVEWIQQAALGGAGPLAMALTFTAFWFGRHGRWPVAAFLASISVVVRPEGVFSLIALGLVLLWLRQFRTLAWCVAIGLLVGALYAAPLYAAFGDPFANYHAYQEQDFAGFIISWPFVTLVRTALKSTSPLTHKLMVTAWILFVLLGVVAMIAAPHFRRHARMHPFEAIYVALLATFYFTYNSEHAFHQFVRFTFSIVPLIYFALLPWIPKDRRILWAAAAVTSAFAGASAMNLRRSITIIRRWIVP